MALSEQQGFSSVTIGEFGHISVRIDRVIYDGEQEVSRTPHRHTIAPGADLSNEHERVKAIATAAWTPDVVARYQEMRALAEAAEARRNAALPQYTAEDLAPLNALVSED